MATTIEQLRAQTENCWDMAVDTAEANGPDADRLARAESDREAAMGLWTAAIEALARGDRSAAREALEGAKGLASEWGDDQYERRALETINAS